jgi:hypothetical protein
VSRPDAGADPVRASFRVSLLSASWSLVASALAVAVGLVDGSSVLVVLGAIGFMDGAASAILAEHFLHGLRHEQLSEHRERVAHLAVVFGLGAVGLGTVLVSAWRLFSDQRGDASAASIAVAAASLVVLIALATVKRSLASRVGSPALLGDSRLSGIGAVQAGVAVAGALMTAELGWHWADASAALVVGIAAFAVGVTTWLTELRQPNGAFR